MADVESRKNMTESTGYEGSEGLKARCGKVHRGLTLCFFSMLRVQTLSWWGQAKVLASQRSWQSHLAPSTRTMKRIETGILEKWLVWCYLKVNNVFWPGLPSSSACRRLGSPHCSKRGNCMKMIEKCMNMSNPVEPCRTQTNSKMPCASSPLRLTFSLRLSCWRPPLSEGARATWARTR